MLWFLLRSFDKHLYNFSYKTEKYRWQNNTTCYKNSKTLLFVNSGTTKSFKKLKEDRRQTKDGQRHFSLVPCKAQARSLQDGHRHFSLFPHTAQARSLQNGHWHFSLVPCSAQARFLQDGHRHFGLAEA